jgi:hypothetical protein
MNIFGTSERWRETSRWSARPSAAEFSDALQGLIAWAVFIFTMFAIGGCGYAGTPPKPSVSVSVQPTSAVVALGATQQFQATVSGSIDVTVEWGVNGVANGNAISGTVSGAGLYTAPGDAAIRRRGGFAIFRWGRCGCGYNPRRPRNRVKK